MIINKLPVCPMCGSSMTVRPTAHGDVLDCDNDDQECNHQEDILEGDE